MKKLIPLPLLALALSAAALHAQPDIYFRYANDPDFQTGFISQFHFDDTVTTDITIIIANDTAAYRRLLKELYGTHNFIICPEKYRWESWLCIRDHPEQRMGDYPDHPPYDLVVIQDHLRRASIYRSDNLSAVSLKAFRAHFEYVETRRKAKQQNNQNNQNQSQ
ncbi:MAG: hypothetical protein IJ785_06490 [Bacteroidales bacterium]|nr:hypothetical protein [Bacteroidales bacterium]